jgi:putative addiction module component (TIGR02574 family)
MDISDDIVTQVFALPPDQRYVLAQRLLDSIDETAATEFDARFLEELNRRREELLRGDQAVTDWNEALLAIERSLAQPRLG